MPDEVGRYQPAHGLGFQSSKQWEQTQGDCGIIALAPWHSPLALDSQTYLLILTFTFDIPLDVL